MVWSTLIRTRHAVATAILLAIFPAGLAAAAVDGESCAVANIHAIGPAALQQLKTDSGVSWWLEMDAELFFCGSETRIGELAEAGRLLRVFAGLDVNRLVLARGLSHAELHEMGAQILSRGGRHALVVLDDAIRRALHARWLADEGRAEHESLVPVQPNTAVAWQVANRPRQAGKAYSHTLDDMLAEIDADRWYQDVVSLAAWDRWTMGAEIHDARDWLVQQFEAMDGLSVETQSFLVVGNTGHNVIATLPGTTRPDEWYIVGGHYDAIDKLTYTFAPGAEDNASGCAGVLEMARLFTAHQPEATLVFICYSGEEQGLYGSKYHVSSLGSSGDDDKVQAMLDMDMIGYTSDADLDCLLETRSFGQWFMDALADAAANYTTLRIIESTQALGSDHVPYLNHNITAALTIENDYGSYPHYHRSTDLPSQITKEMGYQVLRMNVAALAELAGADWTGIFDDGFEQGDPSQWSATIP